MPNQDTDGCAMAATPKEQIDGPQHYGGKNNPYEQIKVFRHWLTREEFIGALKFNIWKYTGRGGKKAGAPEEVDFGKGAWYADYLAKFVAENPFRERCFFVRGSAGEIVHVIPESHVEGVLTRQRASMESLSALLEQTAQQRADLEKQVASLQKQLKRRDARLDQLTGRPRRKAR